VLTVDAEPVPPSHGDALDLALYANMACVLKTGAGSELVLFADRHRQIQLAVQNGTVLSGAVRLHYRLEGFIDLDRRISDAQTTRQPLPDRIDIHVGNRVRQRRLQLDKPIGPVAAAIGLAPNRLAEFEAGAVRPEPAELRELARALRVRIHFFFSPSDEFPSPEDFR